MKSFLLFIAIIISKSKSCRNLEVSSAELGTVRFHQIPLDDVLIQEFYYDSGRPAYISEIREKPIFLYHTLADEKSSGIGRWLINSNFGDKNSAMAFINSWAVTPFLIESTSDPLIETFWKIPSLTAQNGWDSDKTLNIKCLSFDENNDLDSSIYFESSPEFASSLSGFSIIIQ
jgi:hypothetical protein